MITFSIREAFSYGWDMLKKNTWLLLEVFALIFGLGFVLSLLSQHLTNQDLSWIATLVDGGTIIIQIFLIMGAMRIALKLHREEPTSLKELFVLKGNRMGSYLWTMIVYILIMMGGFILLIIPGFVWTIKYQFCSWLVIDKQMNAKEALQTSARLTDGNKWKLFSFWIVSMVVYMIGFIIFGVGSIPAGAVVFMATLFIYKQLLKKLDSSPRETIQVSQN